MNIDSYAYDADGERVSQSVGVSGLAQTTTYYIGGLYEFDSAGNTRLLYQFGGQTAVQRSIKPSGSSKLYYLHGDHLGSVSLTTDASGNLVSSQEYKPWGEVRSGGVGETTLNYTGQRKDDTGLLYYHARYYDPVLARFVSADSIVPGAAMGAGGALGTLGENSKASMKGLTVDYHEPGFVASVGQENNFTVQKGFYFQLSSQGKQQAKSANGPLNPQALNRFSYALNNAIRYVDPNGHDIINVLFVNTLVLGQFIGALNKIIAADAMVFSATTLFYLKEFRDFLEAAYEDLVAHGGGTLELTFNLNTGVLWLTSYYSQSPGPGGVDTLFPSYFVPNSLGELLTAGAIKAAYEEVLGSLPTSEKGWIVYTVYPLITPPSPLPIPSTPTPINMPQPPTVTPRPI